MRGLPVAFVVLLFAACNGPFDHYPVAPSGGPVAGGGTVGGINGGDDDTIDAPNTGDGAVNGDGATGGDGSTGGTTFSGRACLVTDLRNPTAGCDPTNAGDINVVMGRNNVPTGPDGKFTMDKPITQIQYNCDRADLEVTIAPIVNGNGNITFPMITQIDYDTLLAANSVTATGGGVVIQVVNSAGLPITGATATTAGATSFYDGNDPQIWSKTSTGAHGVAWIPGLPTAVVTFTVTSGGNTKNVPIESFGPTSITFVTVTF